MEVGPTGPEGHDEDAVGITRGDLPGAILSLFLGFTPVFPPQSGTVLSHSSGVNGVGKRF